MVAAMLRHMVSLRTLKRDHGWIHTLLEEAEKERMHLLTFMKLRQPSLAFRLGVLGAQVSVPSPFHLKPCEPHQRPQHYYLLSKYSYVTQNRTSQCYQSHWKWVLFLSRMSPLHSVNTTVFKAQMQQSSKHKLSTTTPNHELRPRNVTLNLYPFHKL